MSHAKVISHVYYLHGLLEGFRKTSPHKIQILGKQGVAAQYACKVCCNHWSRMAHLRSHHERGPTCGKSLRASNLKAKGPVVARQPAKIRSQFHKVCGLSTEESKQVCKPKKRRSSPSMSFRAAPRRSDRPVPRAKTWLRDLCAEGIEPNPGPSGSCSKQTCWSINVDGASNAFGFRDSIATQRPAIVCLQELNFNKRAIEPVVFTSAAQWF